MTPPPPPKLTKPVRGAIMFLRVKVTEVFNDGRGERSAVQCVDRTGRPTDMVTHVVEHHQLLTKERATA